MKNKNIYYKTIALVIAVLTTLPLLSSCMQNKTVVGTVNGEKVYYDELYFLVSNYKGSVEEKTGGDPELMRQELNALVKENIIKNYAILALCEKWGLSYKDIEDSIDEEFDKYIAEEWNSDRSSFKDSCKEYGLSERYVRFTLGLELLYKQLPAKYVEGGKVATEEEKIIAYVKENFIRVNHLVLFNDEGDDVQANANKIAEAKALLDKGEKINTLIGRGYSEDFGDPDASGYYITKGTMIEDYENAAFNLKVGEHSDVISTYSENNFGEYVSCYYVIQRLEMSDEYIDTYFEALKNDYYNSIINKDLEEIEKTLEFIPNDRYNKLDLTKLPESTNMTVVVIAVAVTAVLTIGAVVVIVVKNNYKKKNISYKGKAVRRK